MNARTCKDCRYIGECQRNYGAHPDDAICTAFVRWPAPPTKADSEGDG